MEDVEKKNLPDETSKANEPLNVNPTNGNPTSPDSKPAEPSKDDPSKDVNAQKAIQEHAELRKKAEEDARKAREETTEAHKATEDANAQLALARKKTAEIAIKSRIERSNIPDSMKSRALKDPIRWLVANAEKVSDKPTWDEVDTLIGSELNGLVESIEKDFGAKPSPKSTFVDVDNNPAPTPSKTLSRNDLSRMTPYEIAQLPKETLDELKKAGSSIKI